MLSALNNQILHQETNNYHIKGFGNDPSRLKDIVNKFGSHIEGCRLKPKPFIYQFEQVNFTKTTLPKFTKVCSLHSKKEPHRKTKRMKIKDGGWRNLRVAFLEYFNMYGELLSIWTSIASHDK